MPMKVNSRLADKTIICISCGQSSSMTVTDSGEVYGWGCNQVGQLGIGNYVNQVNPCKVTTLVGIVIGNVSFCSVQNVGNFLNTDRYVLWTFTEKIVCGYAHVLALSSKGVLYVWGGNNCGQLGLDESRKVNVCSPRQVKCNKVTLMNTN